MRYVGGKKASFKVRGRITRYLYEVPGKGMTFWADPQDAHGSRGRSGWDKSEYEVVG